MIDKNVNEVLTALQKLNRDSKVQDFEATLRKVLHKQASHAFAYGFMVAICELGGDVMDCLFRYGQKHYDFYKQKFLS